MTTIINNRLIRKIKQNLRNVFESLILSSLSNKNINSTSNYIVPFGTLAVKLLILRTVDEDYNYDGPSKTIQLAYVLSDVDNKESKISEYIIILKEQVKNYYFCLVPIIAQTLINDKKNDIATNLLTNHKNNRVIYNITLLENKYVFLHVDDIKIPLCNIKYEIKLSDYNNIFSVNSILAGDYNIYYNVLLPKILVKEFIKYNIIQDNELLNIFPSVDHSYIQACRLSKNKYSVFRKLDGDTWHDELDHVNNFDNDTKQAIRLYTDDSCPDINKYLINSMLFGINPRNEISAIIEKILAAYDKQKVYPKVNKASESKIYTPVKVMDLIRFALPGYYGSKNITDYKINEIISFPMFLSTSHITLNLENFISQTSDIVVFKIVVNIETCSNLYLFIEKISKYESEHEVLLRPNCKFKIINREYTGTDIQRYREGELKKECGIQKMMITMELLPDLSVDEFILLPMFEERSNDSVTGSGNISQFYYIPVSKPDFVIKSFNYNIYNLIPYLLTKNKEGYKLKNKVNDCEYIDKIINIFVESNLFVENNILPKKIVTPSIEGNQLLNKESKLHFNNSIVTASGENLLSFFSIIVLIIIVLYTIIIKNIKKLCYVTD